MFETIKRIFDKNNMPGSKKLSYDQAREVLESRSVALRGELAERKDTQPEMLYFLASDENRNVRRKVAGNNATPGQAFDTLTGDEDDEVRCELAHKIGRLIPDLDDEEAVRLREFAIDALEKLAEDHVTRVRQIIAEELKNADNIPRSIIRKLANDLEVCVAGPVLEYSPLLSDDDLLEVIACGQVKGTLDFIAERSDVSMDVSDAVVATLDVSAVSTLLANENAQIREETLDFIIDNARDVEAWHEPVAMRSELSLRAMRRIAGFVAFSILSDLSERSNLGTDVQAFLKKKVRSRIATEENLEPDLVDGENEAFEAVKSAHESDLLDASWIADAVKLGRNVEVGYALALLGDLESEVIERMLQSKDGKPVTAAVWKAGLPMRIALEIQRHIAHVPPQAMVMARDGVDYSLSVDEMELQINLYK